MCMKKEAKTGKMTIDKLAIMVASGFNGVDSRLSKVEKDIGEIKESNKEIRKDILNLGDRFPSQFAFDQLSSRVYSLEKKTNKKK